MRTEHFEVLVEEPSMEAFLRIVLPKIVSSHASFSIHTHQGKTDLINKLGSRLRGYAKWLPSSWRIIVIVDRDDDDCSVLKSRLEDAAVASGLTTRTKAQGSSWQLVNRIAIEELEAWYFGEWRAVCAAYSRASSTVPNSTAYRMPDNISGGTWEAFERVLQHRGYFTAGLRKVEVAGAIGRYFEASSCRSPSFIKLHGALLEALAASTDSPSDNGVVTSPESQQDQDRRT